jgi:hypothetical protein
MKKRFLMLQNPERFCHRARLLKALTETNLMKFNPCYAKQNGEIIGTVKYLRKRMV